MKISLISAITVAAIFFVAAMTPSIISLVDAQNATGAAQNATGAAQNATGAAQNAPSAAA